MALTQITTDGIKDGTITGTDLATNIDLVDNQKLRIGTGNDLEIYHDGSHSYIDDSSNELRVKSALLRLRASNDDAYITCVENGAVNLYYDNSKKFETTSTGGTVTGRLLTDGVSMGDSEELLIGNGNDFKLRHDGTDNHIASSNGDINIQVADTENAIIAKPNGAVELYHDNEKKLNTTAGGVLVTGDFATTGSGGTITANENLKIPNDTGKLLLGASNDLQIFHTGTNTYVRNLTGVLYLQTNDAAGNANNGVTIKPNGAVELYHDNSKKFQTYSSGIQFFGNIKNETDGTSQGLFLGAANDLQMYHDGNRSAINNRVGELRVSAADNIRIGYAAAGNTTSVDENYAVFKLNGAVELFYDNSKKFETTSGGVNVTGALTVNGAALGGGGKIGQVIQGTRASVFSTTSSSFVDVGLSASITPSASDSKILVLVSLYKAGTDNNTQRLLRNSTTIFAGNASGSRASGFGGSAYDGSLGDTTQLFNGGGFLDTPSTTSAITYKVQIAASGGGTVFVGRDTTDNNNLQHTRNMQTIILMEVLA